MNTTWLSYDAFGRRRSAQNWQTPIGHNPVAQITDNGFGDHEMRDDLGLIHYGGRTHDPHTGQMMQADAVVQAPFNGQNLNRYSYVLNNPMSYTDPSGFVTSFAGLFFGDLLGLPGFASFVPMQQKMDEKEGDEMVMDGMNMMPMAPGVAIGAFHINGFPPSLAPDGSLPQGGFGIVGFGVTTREDARLQGLITGNATSNPRPGILDVPVVGGLIEGFGDTLGVVGSTFRGDGATVNSF